MEGENEEGAWLIAEDAGKPFRNMADLHEFAQPAFAWDTYYRGYAPAQCNLGVLYNDGKGVEQGYVVARKYYELAADQGDDIAQYNLGTYYFFGFGVDQDYSEAYRLFCLAAEQGYADAIFAVGECYYLGTGVVKDLEIAAEWYQKALDAGFEPRDEEEAEHLKELIPVWGPTAAEESGTETVEDSSSRSIGMYATSGFSISLVQHIKEHN